MSQIHERIAEALRAHQPDELMRARVLADMSPELDELASRFAARRRPARAWLWVPAFACAAAVGLVVWLSTRPAPHDAPAPAAVVELDRELLRPYIVAGTSSDESATTLLAGRFSALDVAPGQLVRATLDRGRIAALGPAHVAVRTATSERVELDLAGTLLVDTHQAARELRVHAGTSELVALNARFAMQTSDARSVVFVDRGTVVLDGKTLAAGEWGGPESARSQALVTELRDHGNSIAPPAEHAGVAAIGGDASIVTESGAVLGHAPLWARLPAGDVVVVAVAEPGHETRSSLAIRENAVTRSSPAAAPEREPVPVPVPVPAPHHVSSHAPSPSPSPSPPPSPSPSPPPPPSPSPPPPPSPVVTTGLAPSPRVTSAPLDVPAQLYARAEAALGAGDRATAETLWNDLVTIYPSSPEAATAHYDLAGLARARGDFAAARAELGRVLASSPPAALREPASYLDCRLQADAGNAGDAATCFRAFRIAFARSTHDAEVLAWLAGHALAAESCQAARPLAEEYVRRYAKGPFAARAKEIAACAP